MRRATRGIPDPMILMSYATRGILDPVNQMRRTSLGIPELGTRGATGGISTGTMMNNDEKGMVIRWTSDHDTKNAEKREDSKSIGAGIDGGGDEHILLEKILTLYSKFV